MLEKKNRIIITGGCGFIGSNFIQFIMKKYPHIKIINIDKLTYSGNLNNLKDITNNPNYTFIQEDICNHNSMLEIIKEGDVIVNFAAESHVDNSILDPQVFIKTNILGAHSILEAARKKNAELFMQISTDEVYGSLNFDQNSSKEIDSLSPSSPYSASKAAAEMICIGNMKTFKQPIIITRSSNNFGPYQFPEKVIPLFVTNLLEGKKVPVYGTGKNIRDWIYVLDNCEAIEFIINNGKAGEIYNIGGGNEIQNIDLTRKILKYMGLGDSYMDFVIDRKGHDLRYSLNSSKIKNLGWNPKFTFEEAFHLTINWYKQNKWWWEPLKNIAGKRVS
jgi:dTDP-glucose 4,6-dehydratase